MPTIFTHAIAGAAVARIAAPGSQWKALSYAAAFAAMLPDADVIAFYGGVPYGEMLGHRGLTHSLAFACVMAFVGTAWFWNRAKIPMRFQIAACLAVAAASHGFLDAFTNGGRGVAFFAPFRDTRYFFPVTPIEVSPLGLRFFSQRGMSVLASEIVWVWCPVLLLLGIVSLVRRARRG